MMTLHEMIWDGVDSAIFDKDARLSAEEITVYAWMKYKDVLGLQGFSENHPDFHKVCSALCGRKGMVNRGYFHMVGEKAYSLGNRPMKREQQADRLPKDPKTLPAVTTNGYKTLKDLKRFLAGKTLLIKRYKLDRKNVTEMTKEDMRKLFECLDPIQDIHKVYDTISKRLSSCWDQPGIDDSKTRLVYNVVEALADKFLRGR